jgi:hypothetical protein
MWIDPAVWARVCATGGAAVWAALAVLARVGVARFGTIELMFLFAPLVIVPLGMELIRMMGLTGRLDQVARWLQPIGAALAVAALWRGPGPAAALMACGWLAICLLMAAAGASDLVSAWSFHGKGLFRFAVGTAKIDLAVGGMWLVASRFGMRPMGIQEPIGLLTAVHFHFAGFATAMIGAATLDFAEHRGRAKWLRRLIPFVIGMPYLVAAGFVISPLLKMIAAALFSLSVAVLAVFVRACGRRAEDAAARVWLQVSAAAVFAGMVLAAMYAVADFAGSDVLTIPQMARTHGVLNAVGFCMAGLLGWLVEYSHPLEKTFSLSNFA